MGMEGLCPLDLPQAPVLPRVWVPTQAEAPAAYECVIPGKDQDEDALGLKQAAVRWTEDSRSDCMM